MIRKGAGMTVGVSINRPLAVVVNGMTTMMMIISTDTMNLGMSIEANTVKEAAIQEEVNTTNPDTETTSAVAGRMLAVMEDMAPASLVMNLPVAARPMALLADTERECRLVKEDMVRDTMPVDTDRVAAAAMSGSMAMAMDRVPTAAVSESMAVDTDRVAAAAMSDSVMAMDRVATGRVATAAASDPTVVDMHTVVTAVSDPTVKDTTTAMVETMEVALGVMAIDIAMPLVNNMSRAMINCV